MYSIIVYITLYLPDYTIVLYNTLYYSNYYIIVLVGISLI